MSGVIGDLELQFFEWGEEQRAHEAGTCHELPYPCPLCMMEEFIENDEEWES